MIRELYDARREALEKELGGCEDVKAAADAIGSCLEKMRLEARSAAGTPALRRETDRVFESARQAARLMLSVTEANVSVSRRPVTGKGKIKAALPWVSSALGFLLTLWMIMLGQTAPAVVALLSGASGVLWAFNTGGDGPQDVAVTTKVNGYELMRMMDGLTSVIDDALTQAENEQAQLPGAGRAEVTGDILSPVQMLMEAVYTGDGEYALKAAPQLREALSGQGIEIVEYDPAHRDWFDMFPGTEAGLTIRPAMVKDGRLLARGQATEAIDG